MKSKSFGYTSQFVITMLLCFFTFSLAQADEPGPGMVYPTKRKAVVAAPPPRLEVYNESEVLPEPVYQEEDCEWGTRLAVGVPIWFFDEENNLTGGGLYGDLFNNDRRINLRVGVEGRHMYLGQDAAASAAEFPGKTPQITYLRIPFSAEYIVPIDENRTQLFIGGGPDIVHTANDIGSTEVGAHLSTRILHNFDPNWGIALEAGYMWGEAEESGEDVNLDGAYLTPTLNYTF